MKNYEHINEIEVEEIGLFWKDKEGNEQYADFVDLINAYTEVYQKRA